jgi:type IV secretion system protein VirB10
MTTLDVKSFSSALPLKGEASNYFKIIPYCFVVVITLFLVLYLTRSSNHKDIKREVDTYDLHSMSPHSNNQENTAPVNNNDLQLQQRMAEVKAKDFVERLQTSQNASVDAGSGSMVASGTALSSSSPSGDGLQTTGNIQPTTDNPNTAFLLQASNSKAEREYATHLGPLPYVIGQGKFIFGTLAVAINSDLPGQVSATVSQDIYGEQGRIVLIPRGSRMVGEYRSGLVNNQSRLFVVWTRVIEPNGLDIRLGSEGTDALGRAGLTGKVDYHFFERFGTSLLISMIGAGASTLGVSTSNEYNSASAYRQSITQALADQSRNMLGQSINIPPTINIAQGEKIIVFVNRDLDFSRVLR